MEIDSAAATSCEPTDITGASTTPRTLSALPDELITAILHFLDARSVTRFAQTAKRFTEIAREAVLWQKLCLQDWRFWDARHNFHGKHQDRSCQQWKTLYTTHDEAHRRTAQEIQAIIDDPLVRLNRAQTILNFGYDAKDTLLDLVHNASSSESPLAQKYWAKTLLECLHRSIALEQWHRLRFRSDVENPTELALACLDMFILEDSIEGDIDDCFRRLNEYVDAVRSAYPDIDDQTPKTKAIVIAEFLRNKKWVGIDDEQPGNYGLDVKFLSYSLYSPSRNSLPLITAVIYTYVCRQFDLRAAPINYPFHIHALVQPPIRSPPIDLDGNPLQLDYDSETLSLRTHLYMDPFRDHAPIPPSTLNTQLRFMIRNAPAAALTHYLSPASARDMLSRNARNILASLQDFNPRSTISQNNAMYAYLYAQVLFPQDPATLPRHIAELTQHFLSFFPFDLANFRRYVLPLTASWPDNVEYRQLVQTVAEDDATPNPPKYRNEERDRARLATGQVIEEVKYEVGMVFRHKRRGYRAVIWGWDPVCRMSERWIVGNGVDTLPRGRGQPFYNVLVNDQTTRYVAQENIQVLGPGDFGPDDVEKDFGIEVGRWFKSFDSEKCRFISNVQAEYPEN